MRRLSKCLRAAWMRRILSLRSGRRLLCNSIFHLTDRLSLRKMASREKYSPRCVSGPDALSRRQLINNPPMRCATVLSSRLKICLSFGSASRWLLLTIACSGIALLGARAAQAQERCGLAKDFMVQALEHIKTGATNEVEDGLQLLKHANEQCTSFGDAWYYRSLFERKLNQVAKANYSLGKAKMFGSEAMDQSLDPFTLATGAETAGNVPVGPVREKWALVI